LHPVTLEEKVAVNVKVAAVIRADFNTELCHNILLVQPLGNPAKSRVAKVTAVFTLAANIINILSSLLVRANHGVVAVDASGNTRPNTFAVITVLDETCAAWEGVVHRLAFALTENSWPSSVTACHRSVVIVLCETIGKTVSDKYRL